MSTRSESSIQNAVADYAWKCGLIAVKQGGGGAFGRSGWPDYLIVLPNMRCFWIEFKEPKKGVASELQKVRKAQLGKMGHVVYFICDVETGKYAIDKEQGVR